MKPLSAALIHAAAAGVDVTGLIERHTPKRDWKHDPLRLAAAEARRARRQARNLRNLVRS